MLLVGAVGGFEVVLSLFATLPLTFVFSGSVAGVVSGSEGFWFLPAVNIGGVSTKF